MILILICAMVGVVVVSTGEGEYVVAAGPDWDGEQGQILFV